MIGTLNNSSTHCYVGADNGTKWSKPELEPYA
jgi:hypothetical protein